MSEFDEKCNSERPLKNYLWHLNQLNQGKEKNVEQGPLDARWAKLKNNSKDPIRVALIDTGVDTQQPYLQSALADFSQVDFGPALNGVRYATMQSTCTSEEPNIADSSTTPLPLSEESDDEGSSATPSSTESGDARLSDKTDEKFTKDMGQIIDGILGKGASEKLSIQGFGTLNLEDPSNYFGAHGTACAGLVSAAPIKDQIHYYGVNPFGKVLSFATPYSHEILPIFHALCHAYLSGAEVILIPRGIPDYETIASTPPSHGSKFGSRIDTKPTENATIQEGDQAQLSKLLHQSEKLIELIKEIATTRYVVLAAGNDGFKSQLSFPASKLIDDDNVIIVGAMNDMGTTSAYSNGWGLRQKKEKLVWMYSDDYAVVDQDIISIDHRSFDGTDYSFDNVSGVPERKGHQYSPFGILALDVRGSYGHVPGGPEDPPAFFPEGDLRGLFTIFGGTSAASSLVAGIISLELQANGPEALNPQSRRSAVRKLLNDFGVPQ